MSLDVTVTDALRREGLAREIINRVQNIRKERDYDITDRITLTFAPADGLAEVLADFGSYIASQVLATSITVDDTVAGNSDAVALDIDNITLNLLIHKA